MMRPYRWMFYPAIIILGTLSYELLRLLSIGPYSRHYGGHSHSLL